MTTPTLETVPCVSYDKALTEQNASFGFRNVSTDQVQVPSICSLTASEDASLEWTADWLAGVSSDLLAAGAK